MEKQPAVREAPLGVPPAFSALITNVRDFAGPPAVTALLEAGARVFAHDRAFSDNDACEQFQSLHPRATIIKEEDLESALAQAWDASGGLDALISNDHFPAVHMPSDSASLDDMRQTLETLVVQPFALLKAAIPRFKAKGQGNIVMITSCRTKLPAPGGAIPDAARAAANALVHSLAIELAPHQIAVNAIAPNFLYSEAYYPKDIFMDDPRGRAFIAENVPAGRLGKPEEIGDVIRFLATTEARFLTGAIIDFSGGWPASPPRS